MVYLLKWITGSQSDAQSDDQPIRRLRSHDCSLSRVPDPDRRDCQYEEQVHREQVQSQEQTTLQVAESVRWNSAAHDQRASAHCDPTEAICFGGCRWHPDADVASAESFQMECCVRLRQESSFPQVVAGALDPNSAALVLVS